MTAVSFSHDGAFLATGSKDRTIKILAAATGELFTTYNGHRQQFGQYKGQFTVFDVAFAGDSPRAFSAGEGPVIRVWEPLKVKQESGTARDMEERFAKGGHTKYLVHNASAARVQVGVQRRSGVCGVWRWGGPTVRGGVGGKLVREYQGHSDWVFAVDFHAASSRAVSGSYDGEVRVWDTTNGQCLVAFKAAPGYPN